MSDTRNLDDLLCWLEYGRTSGYKAARCSEAQELHWADLLRRLIASHKDLLAAAEQALEQLGHCDCSNGVTSPMGDRDEGEVFALRVKHALEDAIREATA